MYMGESVCVCVEDTKEKEDVRERKREIDKQSGSQGVAQSDKLNVMNEPSSKV